MPELIGGSYKEGYGLKFEWGPDTTAVPVESEAQIVPKKNTSKQPARTLAPESTGSAVPESIEPLPAKGRVEQLTAAGAYPRAAISPEQKIFLEELINAPFLTEEQKRVLYMRFVEGTTLQEAASLMGYQSKEMARQHQNKALLKLLRHKYITSSQYNGLRHLLSHWA